MEPTAAEPEEQRAVSPRLELAIKVFGGLATIVMAAWCLARLQHGSHEQLVVSGVLGTLYALAFRTAFLSSRGGTVPTEPVFVAMLMTLPATWIPPLVLAAVCAGSVDDKEIRGLAWWQTVIILGRQAWVAVLPTTALLVLGSVHTGASWLTVIVTVIAVQLVADAALLLVEHLPSDGTSHVLRPLAWTMAVDAMLAIVGYSIVEATHGRLPGLTLIAAPIVLIRLLAYDRTTAFSRAEDLESAYTEANHEARRDPMTGLLNRRGWEETLEKTLARLRSSPEPMMATVLAADLDRLKFANDTYGHLAGDSLICGFADLLEQCLPAQAAIARLGGDEYAVIVTGPASSGAADLLGIVRGALRTAPDIGPVRISASLGQATYPPATDLQAAVDAADHAARVDKEMRRMTRDHHPHSESA